MYRICPMKTPKLDTIIWTNFEERLITIHTVFKVGQV